MIEKVNREFQILQAECKRMDKMFQTFVSNSPLFNSYMNTIKSVVLISTNIGTSFKQLLSPTQIGALLKVYNTIISELMDRVKQLHTTNIQLKAEKAENSGKMVNEHCVICKQNINQSNIRRAVLTLEQNKRQQFQLVMEQFKKLSEQPLFTQKQNCEFQQILHYQLSQKERVLNVNCNKIEEFTEIMDSTILDLMKLKQLQFEPENQTLPQYANPNKISEDVSNTLQHSFSKKMPQWIQKMFIKMTSYYVKLCNLRKVQSGIQTETVENIQLKQSIKEKRQLQKENKQLNDELKQLKLCYKRLQQINHEHSEVIAKLSISSNRRAKIATYKQKQSNRQKSRKNSIKLQRQSSNFKVQVQSEQQENITSNIIQDQPASSALITKRRKGKKTTTTLPKIRNPRLSRQFVAKHQNVNNIKILKGTYKMLPNQKQVNIEASNVAILKQPMENQYKNNNQHKTSQIQLKSKQNKKSIQQQKIKIGKKEQHAQFDLNNKDKQKKQKNTKPTVGQAKNDKQNKQNIQKGQNTKNVNRQIKSKKRKEVPKESNNKSKAKQKYKQSNFPLISSKNSSMFKTSEYKIFDSVISSKQQQSKYTWQQSTDVYLADQYKLHESLPLAEFNQKFNHQETNIMKRMSSNIQQKVQQKRTSLSNELQMLNKNVIGKEKLNIRNNNKVTSQSVSKNENMRDSQEQTYNNQYEEEQQKWNQQQPQYQNQNYDEQEEDKSQEYNQQFEQQEQNYDRNNKTSKNKYDTQNQVDQNKTVQSVKYSKHESGNQLRQNQQVHGSIRMMNNQSQTKKKAVTNHIQKQNKNLKISHSRNASSDIKQKSKTARKTTTEQNQRQKSKTIFSSEKAQLKAFEVLQKNHALPKFVNYHIFASLVQKAGCDLQNQLDNQQQKNSQKMANDQETHPNINEITHNSIYGRLFVNKTMAYKYEQSMTKSYHKKILKQLTHTQSDICFEIYKNLCEAKKMRKQIYTQFCSILRYPYQTIYNNFEVVNFVSQMSYDTFEYFFRKIIWIHRKCQKHSKTGVCVHIQQIIEELHEKINSTL